MKKLFVILALVSAFAVGCGPNGDSKKQTEKKIDKGNDKLARMRELIYEISGYGVDLSKKGSLPSLTSTDYKAVRQKLVEYVDLSNDVLSIGRSKNIILSNEDGIIMLRDNANYYLILISQSKPAAKPKAPAAASPDSVEKGNAKINRMKELVYEISDYGVNLNQKGSLPGLTFADNQAVRQKLGEYVGLSNDVLRISRSGTIVLINKDGIIMLRDNANHYLNEMSRAKPAAIPNAAAPSSSDSDDIDWDELDRKLNEANSKLDEEVEKYRNRSKLQDSAS